MLSMGFSWPTKKNDYLYFRRLLPKIINMSFDRRVVSQMIKNKVIHNFNKRDPTMPDNYLPISIHPPK